MAVSYVDRQTLAVLAPTVREALGISATGFGWLLSAFALAYLVGAPVAGRLVDHLGARRGLLGAVLAWSVVAALHALVPSFAVLLVLRVALGLAEAPSFPGAAQTVQRSLPPSQRALGFGILFCGSSIGAMVAAPLATYLEARHGFRIAFLGTALAGLVWVPAWLLVAFPRAARERLDAEVAHESGASIPSLIRAPAVWRFMLVVFVSAPFLNLMIAWASSYLVADRGMKQADVGGILMIPPLVFDAGSIGFGALASWIGRRTGQVAPPYLLVAAAVLVGVGALVPYAPTPFSAMVVASVAMAGGAGMYGLGTVDALSRVPPRAVATVGGIGAAAQSIVQIVVNPAIGRWVDVTHSYTMLFVGLALLALPGAVVWVGWKPGPVPGSGGGPGPSVVETFE